MFRTLKITTDPARVFFTSDLHVGHDRDFIWGPRGFTNVHEHTEALVKAWNSVVTDEDVVFNLGDPTFKTDAHGFWALHERLRFGRLYILVGNHTSGHKQAYAETLREQYPALVSKQGEFNTEVYPLTRVIARDSDGAVTKLVTFLPTYVEVVIGGESVVLCHYPLASHHHIGHGVIHLSGHCHGNLPLTHARTGKGRRLDVGPESIGLAPWSFAQIKAHLAARDLDVPDHHGRKEAL